MPPKLTRDEQRLLTLAKTQMSATHDPEVRDCWQVLVDAIGNRWIVAEGWMSLQELIDALEAGSGAGAEEYSIDVDEEDDSLVMAAFVNHRYRCPRDAMLRELRLLEQRRRRTPQDPDQALADDDESPEGSFDPDALRRMFQLLAGAQDDELPDSPEGERVRAEVRDQLAALASSPDALDSEEVRAAVAGVSPTERAKIGEALRAFAAWAEQPERGGAAVDEAIRGLEATLGRLARGGPAQERETQERITRSAQDAIARRLRDAGLS